MTEIIKICKYHGDLRAQDIKTWPYKNKIYRRCKQCIHEKNKRYQARMRADPEWVNKNKEKDKKYWIDNKERITEKRKSPERLEKRRKTYLENVEKYREQCNKKQRSYRDDIHESYMRKIIMENSELKINDIPDSLVKAKVEILKLKRAIRNVNKKHRST